MARVFKADPFGEENVMSAIAGVAAFDRMKLIMGRLAVRRLLVGPEFLDEVR